MRLLILGFGPLAREIVARVKRFPEYGFDNKIAIYHIQTSRNSLSYPRDLVVEIPDPHGDGYRTYKDGFQALDGYSTTVSNYVPWLLAEARQGSFHIIVDCTNSNTESQEMIDLLMKTSKNDCVLLSPNKDGNVDAVITKLRDMIDGGLPWEPIEFSQELLKEAADAWEVAQPKMIKFHQINRKHDIETRGDPQCGASTDGYSFSDVVVEKDWPLIDRFIANDDPKGGNSRTERYDAQNDCIIVTHDMLTYFFGWFPAEQVAAANFGFSEIEIESGKYIKYMSDKSTHVGAEDADYVIECVHRGTMSFYSSDGKTFFTLEGGKPGSSFAYRPEINSPKNVKVSKDLETIVFTYRKWNNDN